MKRVEGRESRVESRQDLSRRETVKLLVIGPLGIALAWRPSRAQLGRFLRASPDPRPSTLDLKFFTSEEYETVRVLVDLILPRDERSGSATDAGVPEFMDFMLADEDTPPGARTAMQGGLAWVDAECRRRFGQPFTGCAGPDRAALLDDIAWPDRARPEMSHGAAFLNSFRDLTASGFWSSEMGVKDLQYKGNAFIPEWKGCPDAALQKIGVTYDKE